jgi:hypothetical protein
MYSYEHGALRYSALGEVAEDVGLLNLISCNHYEYTGSLLIA